jgi:hypothetical protein
VVVVVNALIEENGGAGKTIKSRVSEEVSFPRRYSLYVKDGLWVKSRSSVDYGGHAGTNVVELLERGGG